MTPTQIAALDWDKNDGLLPAIVQHVHTGKVLMQAYMNQAALSATLDSKQVTFFSRSKQRLWVKGETSGHVLRFIEAVADCDQDSLLIIADPIGPTCHTGTLSCFGNAALTTAEQLAFLKQLEDVIAQRIAEAPEGSYTARIWSQGLTRMAQKVGEEGVEVALAAVTQDNNRLISEAADLLYHLSLVLKSRNLSLVDVTTELAQRHNAK